MTASILLDDDDITWLNGYAAEVCDAFRAEFRAAEVRFTGWQPLLLRFTEAVDCVLHSGRRYFSAVDEAHNELCVASAILGNPNPRIARLEYEPPLPGCAKSIDFGATAEDGVIVYVDVKTIKPVAKDRWDQYERAHQEQWLPANVRVALSRDWLGGEIWHSMFTARGRMLEYALELEGKIAEAKLAGDSMATRDSVQGGAERLLADIREIKAALAEGDPDEQRHLRWLLKGIHRKVTGHRVWLESLREDPRAGSEIEEQIALFAMIEHECRVNDGRERPA